MGVDRGKSREIKKSHEPFVTVSSKRELSSYIRNSLTRLDMLIYLDRKDEAQAEIQIMSEQLEKMGI